jgi:hypothetical protein
VPEHQPYQRDEDDAHRLDRNFSELLQELRVAQAGVQILFAFLLSIAFQQRFTTLSTYQHDIYLATLLCAALAAVFFIAPVALHRVMFRLHLKDEIVRYSARMAGIGLVLLALAMLGSVLLIVDVVSGPAPAVIVTIALAVVFGTTWVAFPLSAIRRPRQR